MLSTEDGESTSRSRPSESVVVTREEHVAIVELHRPKAMNALDRDMTEELLASLQDLDSDVGVRVIIVTGGDRVFAAGVDINDLSGRGYSSVRFKHDFGKWMDQVANLNTPTIAAVNGFALGGGCELAMSCDIIIASEDAVFGQPEIQIGMIPGWGGTQRLLRAVGKAKAMEMILTGRQMTAEEAESSGLVSRVATTGRVLEEARDVANVIAKYSTPVVRTAKECVDVAAEVGLRDGLRFERRAFQATFALEDSQEGVRAFLEKRSPKWKHK